MQGLIVLNHTLTKTPKSTFFFTVYSQNGEPAEHEKNVTKEICDATTASLTVYSSHEASDSQQKNNFTFLRATKLI